MSASNKAVSLQEKVFGLYRTISERGLFVDTNYDIFLGKTEEAPFGSLNKYRFQLLDPDRNGRALSSSLLFPTITCLLNHGTCLSTGAVGIGKTTGAEFAGHFFTGTPLHDILEGTVQGHPQQTQESMVAYLDLGLLTKNGKRVAIPQKFMTAGVHMLDEIRRLDPSTLAILLRLIDTGKTTYQGQLIVMKPGPVFATANYDDEGSAQLLPPAADRFDVAVMVTSPSSVDVSRILSRRDEKLNGGSLDELLSLPAAYALSDDDRLAIRHEISSVHVPQDVENYLDYVRAMMRFCEVASASPERMTKGNAWQVAPDEAASEHYLTVSSSSAVASHRLTRNELSVRTHKALDRYAKALAWFQGKDSVSQNDVSTVWPFVTWHRLHPSKHALQTPGTLYANDRIGFATAVFSRCVEEFDELNTDSRGGIFVKYTAGMQALTDEKYSLEKKQTAVTNAIQQLGESTHPYALVLAQYLASEYNTQASEK